MSKLMHTATSKNRNFHTEKNSDMLISNYDSIIQTARWFWSK